MRRHLAAHSIWLLLAGSAQARQEQTFCGTYRERWKVEQHLHRQAQRVRRAARTQAVAPGARARSAARDFGNIVVLDDTDGVVAGRNPFDLDRQTLTFTPTAAAATSYKFQVSGDSYDAAAAAFPSVVPMGDDDTRTIPLPFPFPFFGVSYQTVFVNSDGNLTFGSGDGSSTERGLGQVIAGPPRIAPLFEDLDPSQSPESIHVLADATRMVVSWAGVPEYGGFTPEIFQVRLFPDGRIEFAWHGVFTNSAVVGISPGNLQGSASVVSFSAGSASQYPSTVAERFGGNDEVDLQSAAQRFYETHEDAYDYLVFFNNLEIPAAIGAVAFEVTVRSNNRSGYSASPIAEPIEIGAEFGSPARLQAVINMGPLSQYPVNPADVAAVRASSGGYTGLALVAHETGHLFLAYASVADPDDPTALPMLGIQQSHWAYNFNAEASFMEGNRISDAGASPRFTITDAVDNYSPLDQYLMGFRAASEVPPTFLSTGHPASFSRQLPQIGATFNGGRRDIQVEELIQKLGRRTPDSTVAQRHFRFAFVLIAGAGTIPPQNQLDQLEAYRSQFEAYYAKASSQRGAADTALKRALQFSLSPAAGVLAGHSGTATLSTQSPLTAPLTVALSGQTGAIALPALVNIPAGAASVSFSVIGLHAGVDQVIAVPSDPAFETAVAKIQVAAASGVKLVVTSGDQQASSSALPLPQPVVIRATDINNLPYPGAPIQALPSPGSSVTPAIVQADATGTASFQWTPGTGQILTLQVFIQGTLPTSGVLVTALPPGTGTLQGVSNALTGAPGLAPGMLASAYGQNLAGGADASAPFPWPFLFSGVSVAVNNETARVLFVSNEQVNFLVPGDLVAGMAAVTITTKSGTSAPFAVMAADVSPAIFVLDNGYGAILHAGTAQQTTAETPALRGQFIEIYCIGLGAVVPSVIPGLFRTTATPRVFIGGQEAQVTFSGLAPSYQMGVYQIDAQVSAATSTGAQRLVIVVNGVSSNSVLIGVQ